MIYKEFIAHINQLKKHLGFKNEFLNLTSDYGYPMIIPTLCDEVVELLEIIMGDKNNLIGQWVFEYQFGEKSKEYGSDIVTIDDLWQKLTE